MPTLATVKVRQARAAPHTSADVARERSRSARYAEVVALVGMRMKLRRREAGYSLRRLKELTGIDINTISKIERGEQNELSAGNFFTLCEALALDPMRAWYGEERKPGSSRRSEPPPASVRRPTPPPPAPPHPALPPGPSPKKG